MKFLCICLSPAIDATVRMDAWPTDGRIIKNAADTFAPGGKAVNVARWLALFTYYADKSLDIREQPKEMTFRDITVEDADRFIHYNFSGNET